MLPKVFFTLSCMITYAIAAPFQAETRGPGNVLDVVDPKILTPTQDTVWVVGNQYSVTWDNSDLPPLANITNVKGEVALGQFNGNGEKLYLDNPLAEGFLITDSSVEITVPKVPDGDYIIVLFGDSGNQSPQFRIVNNPLSSILAPQSTASSVSSSVSSAAPAASASNTPAVTTGSTSSPSSSSSVPFTFTSSPSSTSGSSVGSATSLASTLSIPASVTASSTGSETSGTSTAAPTSNDAASWWNANLQVFAFTSAAISVALAL